MSRIKAFLSNMGINLKTTVFRFPVTLLYLAAMTTIVFLTIEDNFGNEALLGRLFFTGIFGALLSTAIQFTNERFNNLSKFILVFHSSTFLLSLGYYYFMTNDEITQSMVIHLFVISFALFAAYLYMPSAKNEVNFGNVALSHFKSAFTAILYGLVLFLGFVAIFGAVDILLFNLDTEIYAHTANIAFVFFTPVYYLSLLPEFNSKDESNFGKNEAAFNYPRVLEVLVSFIITPLISVFSVVLILYFLKILITGVWPVGQVGPMVLAYSAAGYFIYILGSNLENRFSYLYRKIFPILLIPLVAMQLVSSYIRVEAYGITESRYYVILFGIFSIVCATILIFKKKKNSNSIVLLSAIFAILSIIPPVDAFTISRNSQEGRLEEILIRNNMLADNEIVPKENVSNEDKHEITNISDYLARMGYLRDIEWFPEEHISESGYYRNFEVVYGFSPYYGGYEPGEIPQYIYARLDDNEEIDVSDYDKFLKVNIYSSNSYVEIGEFTIDGDKFTVKQKSGEKDELIISISDNTNNTLIEVDMKEFINTLIENVNEPKASFSQKDLTSIEKNEKIDLKIIVNELSIDRTAEDIAITSGNLLLFVAVP